MFNNMENKMFGFNENSVNKALENQEKIIKGIRTLMDVDYSGYDETPKELVFSEDKIKLFHYEPMIKDINKRTRSYERYRERYRSRQRKYYPTINCYFIDSNCVLDCDDDV